MKCFSELLLLLERIIRRSVVRHFLSSRWRRRRTKTMQMIEYEAILFLLLQLRQPTTLIGPMVVLFRQGSYVARRIHR